MELRNPNYGLVIGVLYCLGIVAAIVAKLTGHLAWAWWIVLLPIWAPIVLIVALALIMIVGFAGAESRGENPFE